ncbi:MAG: fibronectin type III domain-containing protein, partial [Bacteroidota bacterium]|nr:fibronectin type III domain-containing protein [Bacteroidota bacterium]
NLVANPYPSPIDWYAASGWTKTNVDDAIYFFSPTSTYYGQYNSYVNGISSGNGASNIIPAMQAFFVKCNNPGGSGLIQCDNRVRTNQLNPTFYKSGNESKKIIRLDANNSGYKFSDQIVIYFDKNATMGFDHNFDAYKPMNNDISIPNFYCKLSKDINLSINALPFLTEDKTIPLGFRAMKSGTFTIKLKEISNFLEGENVILEDTKTGKTQSLKENPVYTFTAKDGDPFDGRFFLHITTVNCKSCSLPQSLNVTDITPTSAKLNWSRVDGAQAYFVRYWPKNNPNIKKMYFAKPGQNSFSVNGLEAGKTYEWQIRVMCGLSNSQATDFSLPKEFTTLNGDYCAAPTNLRVSSIGISSAELLWIGNNGATKYTIRWREAGNYWHYASVAGNVHSFKLGCVGCDPTTKLKSITSYEWQIMSYCSNQNNSEYSGINRFKTIGNNKNDEEFTTVNQISYEGPNLIVYPNPYSQNTTINYQLPEISNVKLEVFNIIGEKIKTLTDGIQNKGNYKTDFSAQKSGYPSGIYFIRLNINGKIYQQKAVEF